jgi:hypothetical protein
VEWSRHLDEVINQASSHVEEEKRTYTIGKKPRIKSFRCPILTTVLGHHELLHIRTESLAAGCVVTDLLASVTHCSTIISELRQSRDSSPFSKVSAKAFV